MLASGRSRVRAAAVCALIAAYAGAAHAQTQDHQYSTADIEAGSRLYANQCTLCHGPNGDAVSGINLRRGQFRRPLSDDELRRVITIGVPNAGMPPFKFQPNELDGLVAFIRAGFDVGGTAVKIGDAARGEALFQGKGGCTACHRVNGRGPRVAPDLSDVGAIRSPASLHRSLVEPSKGMMPINRPFTAVTRDGKTVRGRRLNEDTETVQVIDEQERLLTLAKSELRGYELSTTSPMPPATRTLSGDEIADVIAYLLSLRGVR
jgi:putative heme-binding domain-containing protein